MLYLVKREFIRVGIGFFIILDSTGRRDISLQSLGWDLTPNFKTDTITASGNIEIKAFMVNYA